MKNDVTIHLGTNKEERKASLLQLATATAVIGRNLQPSISELICLVADAFEAEPTIVASYVCELKHIKYGNRMAASDAILLERPEQ